VKGWGVERVQYTDVSRDGTLDGPNLDAIAEMARGTGLRITAAGGVSTLDDLVRLSALEELGVDEAISGKALYDECFTLAEARATLAGAEGER
jgi:phosphoribosylformimino-5-aminoimidazole carboxamide ribonucleotide (ProFAR) isomerase